MKLNRINSRENLKSGQLYASHHNLQKSLFLEFIEDLGGPLIDKPLKFRLYDSISKPIEEREYGAMLTHGSLSKNGVCLRGMFMGYYELTQEIVDELKIKPFNCYVLLSKEELILEIQKLENKINQLEK